MFGTLLMFYIFNEARSFFKLKKRRSDDIMLTCISNYMLWINYDIFIIFIIYTITNDSILYYRIYDRLN